MLIPVIWVAAGHSTLAVALGLLGVEVVMGTVRLLIVCRVLGTTMGQHARALAGPLAAAAVTAVVVAVADRSLPDWPSVLRIGLCLPVAVLLWAAALWLFARPVLLMGLRLLKLPCGRRLVGVAGAGR